MHDANDADMLGCSRWYRFKILWVADLFVTFHCMQDANDADALGCRLPTYRVQKGRWYRFKILWVANLSVTFHCMEDANDADMLGCRLPTYRYVVMMVRIASMHAECI